MTRCDEIRPRLAAWLDGELGDVDRQTVDNHLAGCVDCTAVVHGYRAIKPAVVLDTSANGLWDAVAARIDEADTITALLTELRQMRDEMRGLRAEVADLRSELARRSPAYTTRTSPFSFPDAPERPLSQYRLV